MTGGRGPVPSAVSLASGNVMCRTFGNIPEDGKGPVLSGEGKPVGCVVAILFLLLEDPVPGASQRVLTKNFK